MMSTRDTSLQIIQTHPGVLTVKKRRLSALLGLVPAAVFIIVFYYVLPGVGEARQDGWLEAMHTWLNRTWLNWLILFLPLVVLPKVIDTAGVLRRGDVFTFDQNSHQIRRNGELLASFDDVSALRVATVNGGCEELCVSLQRRDGPPQELHVCASLKAAVELADAVAQRLGVDVVCRT